MIKLVNNKLTITTTTSLNWLIINKLKQKLQQVYTVYNMLAITTSLN